MNNRTRSLSADDRRTATIEAVIALAGSQNPGDITTAAIAKHMNLTQGALFRHFPTKESVWHSVMDWVATQLLARIDGAAEGIDSPLVAMQAMFMSHVAFVIEHPGVPRMMFGELQKPEATPARQVARGLMRHYAERIRIRIDQGKAAGEIASEVDTGAAAMLFIGTIQGLVMQSMMSGDLQRIRVDAPDVFTIYRRGIGARP